VDAVTVELVVVLVVELTLELVLELVLVLLLDRVDVDVEELDTVELVTVLEVLELVEVLLLEDVYVVLLVLLTLVLVLVELFVLDVVFVLLLFVDEVVFVVVVKYRVHPPGPLHRSQSGPNPGGVSVVSLATPRAHRIYSIVTTLLTRGRLILISRTPGAGGAPLLCCEVVPEGARRERRALYARTKTNSNGALRQLARHAVLAPGR
jgi:hypothetical protein